jgi:GMP synthase (glutamine-hydrolysing)
MNRPREPKPILVLQHADCEPPGAYEEELRARGVPLRRLVLDQGDDLPPDWRSYAGMIVMGGPMGAYEDSLHPWLGPEKRLIAEAVAGDLPYWGVCLGAQLLAAALGARVAPGPEAELGVLSIELTEGAALDSVFGPAPRTFEALQWHGDTFELPPGATQMARSTLYEQQAFVIGRAYGLQFHLEVTTALAGNWMEVPAYISELQELAGPDSPTRLLEQLIAATPTSVPLARRLFSRWLERVVGLPGTPR